jgi:hypothetical protein
MIKMSFVDLNFLIEIMLVIFFYHALSLVLELHVMILIFHISYLVFQFMLNYI